MMYYPEMGGKPALRLFKTRHSFRDSYYVEWLPAVNDDAVATLKRLRIKAKYLKFDRVGFELVPEAKSDKWSCLVTSGAHDKLLTADLCAHEMLLD